MNQVMNNYGLRTYYIGFHQDHLPPKKADTVDWENFTIKIIHMKNFRGSFAPQNFLTVANYNMDEYLESS